MNAQDLIMAALEEMGEATTVQLAEATGLDRRTAAGAIHQLKFKGLVSVARYERQHTQRFAFYRPTGAEWVRGPIYPQDRVMIETLMQAAEFASRLYAAHPRGYADSKKSIKATSHVRLNLSRLGPPQQSALA